MSSENQTNIRFSLKETVWFQKGQEVKEVRSLSLNPDITIQQFDEYVQVKGVLTLEGNYTPDQSEQGDYYSLRELAPSRLVEDVRSLEDGSCDLHHKFPVDISIPLTRIPDLENLCVSVETFDYQLERGCIQIAADLCISGLHDNQTVNHYYEQREQEQYNTYTYSNDYRSSSNEDEPKEREQDEQFQFFNQQPTNQSESNNNLYGSDWIQSLEDEDHDQEEVQDYPKQPTYLEVFQPPASNRDDEVTNQSEQFAEEEENNYAYLAEQTVEQPEEAQEAYRVNNGNFEHEELQTNNNFGYEELQTNNNFEYEEPQTNNNFEYEEPQTNNKFEYEEPRINNNFEYEQPQTNNNFEYNPEVNNDYYAQQGYLNSEVKQQPSFLNNDFSSLQNNSNNEYNVQNEMNRYEEQYNRSVEQSFQPYFNTQYQQRPFSYNPQQQPFYQNPYSPANQADQYVNPGDVRQTPPYYADYYQAQVEQVEDQKETNKPEEENAPRSVKSDNLLSTFFSGEGKEESYTKLKLYLAQNGDTIETVAKKYNLQTQQLNRVNNLNDEFLSEGQIIYIPVSAIKQ